MTTERNNGKDSRYKAKAVVDGKRVLVFGGTGSLGLALIRRWIGKCRLGVYSRDEAKHWTIKNSLKDSREVEFFVGDIRDTKRVEQSIAQFQPNIILVASALKQVETCETAPEESIKTNILGVSNVISAAQEANRFGQNLECVLLISTDKACSPTNVYGMSKSIAERLVVANSAAEPSIKFINVRYGNVLDSRGSIVPLFRYQSMNRSSFTLTSVKMTRFLMTLDESIDLIEIAISQAKSGETWIPKPRSMSILDLAEIFSDKYNKEIEVVGIRPGEKIHEELISEMESFRTEKLNDNFIIHPPMSGIIKSETAWKFTSADNLISKSDLLDFLEKKRVFDTELKNFIGKEIEEIRRDT